jgi:hypothetical protein
LVVVSTPTFESAYRIFSVLNDRGMDLSHADVLKADVLGAIAREDERDAYAAKWEEVEEDLGRDAFRDLISFVRTIFVRKKVERSVLAEVRDLIKPASRPKWFLDEVIFPTPTLWTSSAARHTRVWATPRRSTGSCAGSNASTTWTGCRPRS